MSFITIPAYSVTLETLSVGFGNLSFAESGNLIKNIVFGNNSQTYAGINAITIGHSSDDGGSNQSHVTVGNNSYSSDFAVSIGHRSDSGQQGISIGFEAGLLSSGAKSVYIGYRSGYNASSAGDSLNTFIGHGSGLLVTSGRRNTIIGPFNGNQSGLDITTVNNQVVISDGAGNPRIFADAIGNVFFLAQATPPVLSINRQMVFNLTSDTNLRISVRGTDGITRTANITLA